jgi:hypothetical protein
MKSTIGFRLGLVLACLLLSACQKQVYLMPSPVGIEPSGGDEFFELTEGSIDENLLYTLYVTNRKPLDSSKTSGNYSVFPGEDLRFGFAVHRVGDEEMGWDQLFGQSLKTDRDKQDLLISSEFTREVGTYNANDAQKTVSSQLQGYVNDINTILKKTFNKDILVYAHGANSNLYRASAQGAQFFHFTGHNTIVMTFSWPSAGHFLHYNTDVNHAEKTIPAFAQAIEFLAEHTDAEHINILAYSAGAQIAAPGLSYLRDQYPDLSAQELKQKLRIGEVYFAAPDTDYKPFVERYSKFKDIVARTTINFNYNDKILGFSAFQHGESRVGNPDDTELTKEEFQFLTAEMATPHLNVIDVGGSEPLAVGGAHDSWYNHPWVSADIIMLLLLGLGPEERGLEAYWTEYDEKMYRFPKGYADNVVDIAKETYAAMQKEQ